MADKDLSALLAELGGDNPQNRAIAEGLQKQGITSVKDIGVQKVPVPGHFEGTDEAAQWVPETTTNAYINKATNQTINPERIGIMQNGQYGLKGGDIFFHLNADQNGNVSFDPQWSPRAHGYLRDNPVGRAIMTMGKIFPGTAPFFQVAGAADAAAHGDWGKAALNMAPMASEYLGITDALKGALGVGEAPTDVYNWSEATNNTPFDDWNPNPAYTGAVDSIPLDAIKQTSNFVNPLESEVTIDDIIKAKDVGAFPSNINDIVGSDWSAGTPTTGMEGIPPADLTNYYNSLADGSGLTQPGLETNNVSGTTGANAGNGVDASGNSLVDLTGTGVDLNGNPVSNTLTLDKALDLGKAYLNNPAALAGVVGTGLAATGLVNNVINPAQTATTNTATQTTSPVASMIPAGPTAGLQDLFNYADLYKNSPFGQQQTTQPTQQPNQQSPQYPGFTVSNVFRSLMAEPPPQQKIEPNLVGLADLQKQMARK